MRLYFSSFPHDFTHFRTVLILFTTEDTEDTEVIIIYELELWNLCVLRVLCGETVHLCTEINLFLRMWLSWIKSPNFQTAPASSLIHKNENPLSIYHHSVNTMNKEFQNDGDRLKEVLTKSIGKERIILPLQFSNHQYFLSHYRS